MSFLQWRSKNLKQADDARQGYYPAESAARPRMDYRTPMAGGLFPSSRSNNPSNH
jgi:hypothetical protein